MTLCWLSHPTFSQQLLKIEKKLCHFALTAGDKHYHHFVELQLLSWLRGPPMYAVPH